MNNYEIRKKKNEMSVISKIITKSYSPRKVSFRRNFPIEIIIEGTIIPLSLYKNKTRNYPSSTGFQESLITKLIPKCR